ncbi:MAG: hypothetical protein WAM65_16765, partial [Candidatus Korobacteraceae bacterium]
GSCSALKEGNMLGLLSQLTAALMASFNGTIPSNIQTLLDQIGQQINQANSDLLNLSQTDLANLIQNLQTLQTSVGTAITSAQCVQTDAQAVATDIAPLLDSGEPAQGTTGPAPDGPDPAQT